MKTTEVLQDLDFGSSVAEFDKNLEHYFVDTDDFRTLISGKKEIISGDKGTGKTALFKIFSQRYRSVPERNDTEIIPAFNPTGNPVFQRLAQLTTLTEGQYRAVWKSYILSLVGNWLLDVFEPGAAHELESLDALLRRIDLRSVDDRPETIFSKITNAIARIVRPKSISADFTFSETGYPMISPKVELFSESKDVQAAAENEISYEEALNVLQVALEKVGIEAWVAIDRLDEAFSGFPEIEIPALRALLRTYLDLQAFPRIRLKLFLRKDLFRRIIEGGFVNLTHINDQKKDLMWEDDDLLHLFANRARGSKVLMREAKLEGKSDMEIFAAMFPKQVGQGQKRPTTWNWILSRIRDGNSVRPPRNLIDLLTKAKDNQLRMESRAPREYDPKNPLIEGEAIRRAHQALSEQRVNDTLLAEASDLAPLIERFRGGKAEQNAVSLSHILDIPEDQVQLRVKPLLELGFLERIGESFKVPMLYRDGLGITQGKAFESADSGEESDEE